MGLRRVGRRARPGGELTIDGGRVLRGRVRNAGGPRFAGKRITVQESSRCAGARRLVSSGATGSISKART